MIASSPTSPSGPKVASTRVFDVLDLFSGIGGFALATEWAGGQTIAFAEVAPYQSRVLAHHWPQVPNLGDVTKLCRRIADCEPEDEDGNVMCPRCGTEFGDCACIGTDQFTDTYGWPDVIAGGVPCQPASLAGKRHGVADERWMWPDTLRIFGELRPRFGILENPRALLSLHGGDAFREILGRFADLGYDVQWDVVSAAALGAGHRRERLWILASNADRTGLERHPRNEQDRNRPGRLNEDKGRHPAACDLRSREITSPFWYRQSGIQPVVNGLPGPLVRDQLTAVGNSLQPQVAHVFMQAIASAFTSNTGIDGQPG